MGEVNTGPVEEGLEVVRYVCAGFRTYIEIKVPIEKGSVYDGYTDEQIRNESVVNLTQDLEEIVKDLPPGSSGTVYVYPYIPGDLS